MLRGKTRRSAADRSVLQQLLPYIVLGLVIFCLLYFLWPKNSFPTAVPTGQSTLIVYAFRSTDPEAFNNFQYFLKHGIVQDGVSQYRFLVPAAVDSEAFELPAAPPNTQFIRPPVNCFETGLVGWFLFQSGLIEPSRFRHFVWLTSAVRGPYLPAYLEGAFPWYQLFTAPLSTGAKLVGSTISCAPLIYSDTVQLQFPHVQQGVMATDYKGLGLLKQERVFECHQTWLENQRHAEYQASEVMLRAGYNLGSLMARYTGVNWLDTSKWDCNARLDPTQDGLYDGTSVNPLEVLFVRVHHAHVVTDQALVRQAMRYESWQNESKKPGATDISSNAWTASANKQLTQLRGKRLECFDSEFYINASPLEFKGWSPAQAFDHFLKMGFKEGRPFQFHC